MVLVFSFIGGAKDGAVKSFFSIIGLFIAIPLTGLSYNLLTTLLSFLPGVNWESFFGFFITFAIISAILAIIFFIPRKFIQKLWKKGLLFRSIGGVLNFFNAAIGLTLFALVLFAYPIFDWLEEWVSGSGTVTWLVNSFGFVQSMLPEAFRLATSITV